MVHQSQTKLLKHVCKQAGLMREPYQNLPWTSRANKKPSDIQNIKTSQSNTKIKSSQSNTKVKKVVTQRSLSIKKSMYDQRIYFPIYNTSTNRFHYCLISFFT